MSVFYPLVIQLQVALSKPNMLQIHFRYFIRHVQLCLYPTLI